MPQLSNEQLTIDIAEKGAELQRIFNPQLQLEYMWSGDPAFWGKKSPVLFPIVGGLRQNTYTVKGQPFHLGRHGFARDSVFAVTAQAPHSITFSLSDNADTRKVYPFHFRFSVRYTLHGTTLETAYLVENTGNETLYFSVGGHPAFKVPLVAGTTYEDYYLEFNREEHTGIWPLSADGLVEREPQPFLDYTRKLPLRKSLFYKDALVFKQLVSTAISLKSDASPHGLEMQFEGFPYMGIWAAKDADFVCIEPWCGIADGVGATGELSEKEGIHALEPGRQFERKWRAVFF